MEKNKTFRTEKNKTFRTEKNKTFRTEKNRRPTLVKSSPKISLNNPNRNANLVAKYVTNFLFCDVFSFSNLALVGTPYNEAFCASGQLPSSEKI